MLTLRVWWWEASSFPSFHVSMLQKFSLNFVCIGELRYAWKIFSGGFWGTWGGKRGGLCYFLHPFLRGTLQISSVGDLLYNNTRIAVSGMARLSVRTRLEHLSEN